MKKILLSLVLALGLIAGAQASGGESIAWDKAPNTVSYTHLTLPTKA